MDCDPSRAKKVSTQRFCYVQSYVMTSRCISGLTQAIDSICADVTVFVLMYLYIVKVGVDLGCYNS